MLRHFELVLKYTYFFLHSNTQAAVIIKITDTSVAQIIITYIWNDKTYIQLLHKELWRYNEGLLERRTQCNNNNNKTYIYIYI